MPNRNETQGLGRGDKAQLGGDRPRPPRVDYGHDENYRPGYHEGGTRFGFFGLGPDRPAETPRSRSFAADPDQEFDPDYLSWRDAQMHRHDRDYADWRREQLRKYDDDYWRFRSERREDFHQRFQDWRAQRGAESTVSTGSEFGKGTGPVPSLGDSSDKR